MSRRRIRVSSPALWWWALVLASVSGALLAYAYGLRVAPVYEAKVTLLVNPRARGPGLEALAQQVPTYAELANSTPLLRAALDKLGLAVAPEELQPDVRGEADTSTRLLTIRVRRQDPAVAAAIANAVAVELIRRVVVAAPPAGVRSEVQASPRLTIIQSASGGARVRPRLLLMVVFGALTGLFGGLTVAVLVASSRRTVRREDELARLAQIPVLGAVDGGLGRPVADGRPLLADAAVEPYRRLSGRILSANGESPPRSLLVVGASGHEGSADVAAQLALAFAGAVGSVVLVDLASDRPVARLFGIGESPAGKPAKRSSSLRQGSLTLERFTVRTGPPLVLGFPRDKDASSARLNDARAVLALLLADADFVVLHAASLGSSPAPLVWARVLDVAVLVVRLAQTRRESVVSAVEALGVAGTDVVGTVLHGGRG